MMPQGVALDMADKPADAAVAEQDEKDEPFG